MKSFLTQEDLFKSSNTKLIQSTNDRFETIYEQSKKLLLDKKTYRKGKFDKKKVELLFNTLDELFTLPYLKLKVLSETIHPLTFTPVLRKIKVEKFNLLVSHIPEFIEKAVDYADEVGANVDYLLMEK